MVARMPLLGTIGWILDNQLQLVGDTGGVHSGKKEEVSIEASQCIAASALALGARVVVENRAEIKPNLLEILEENSTEHDTKDKQHFRGDDKKDSAS